MTTQKKEGGQDQDRAKEVERLSKVYPNVPSEVYDIEASPEIAEMYQDMFGA